MSWNSQEDEARKGKHVLSVERYIPFLLVALKYARMCPAESFPMYKIVFLTGLVVVVIVTIFLNLLSEVAIIVIGMDGDGTADVISVLSTHVVGLMKWCYCTTYNGRLFDIVKKLERCHVFCQRIDSTMEGT